MRKKRIERESFLLFDDKGVPYMVALSPSERQVFKWLQKIGAVNKGWELKKLTERDIRTNTYKRG